MILNSKEDRIIIGSEPFSDHREKYSKMSRLLQEFGCKVTFTVGQNVIVYEHFTTVKSF